MFSICGNFFKTVGKAFQVELVERMPRVCKAVIKAKGFKNLKYKIYLDLFNFFVSPDEISRLVTAGRPTTCPLDPIDRKSTRLNSSHRN